MEKVVNKTYIGGKEVTLIAERCGTKFYVDSKNVQIVYITNYDEVMAKINPFEDTIVDIYDEYKVNNEAN